MRLLTSAIALFSLSLAACAAESKEEAATSHANLDSNDTWSSPDVKSTLHIEYFDPVSACADVGCNTPEQVLLIEGLRESANPTPPSGFDAASWDWWKSTKEYRGFIHIEPVAYACDEYGQISRVGDVRAEVDNGYTKEVAGVKVLGYSEADVYRGGEIFTGTTVEPLDRGDCAIVHAAGASRVTKLGRLATYAGFGYDAPFVWEHVYEKICCDGSVSVSVEHSHFPSSRLYIDNGIVDAHDQRELGRFLRSGGADFHDDGQGLIAGASAAPMGWSGAARPAGGT